MSVTMRPPVDARTTPIELASQKEDLLTVVFGACMMAGVFSDGWAHNNILSEVQADGFFTLWHGLLYSGFAATAAWTYYLAYRRRDRHPRWWVDGWPAGYKIGAIGVLIFFGGGLGDMIWHTVFGIEVSIDALMSPSHLMLSIGSALLLSSPLRSWWASGEHGRRAATGVLSVALATLAASIFYMYASPFNNPTAVLPYDGAEGSAGHALAALGIASYVVTTGVLIVPFLMVHRRRATAGTATALVALVASFPVVTNQFPSPQTAGAVAAIAAAVLADWIVLRLDAMRGPDAPLRLPIAAAVFAALVWAAHLLAIQLDAGIQWPVELWTGTVVITAATAALLGGLAARPRQEVAASTAP